MLRLSAEGWKEKGNELFKAGTFNDAMSAYNRFKQLLGFTSSGRTAAYLKPGSYHKTHDRMHRGL